jgi:hypothetical protein
MAPQAQRVLWCCISHGKTTAPRIDADAEPDSFASLRGAPPQGEPAGRGSAAVEYATGQRATTPVQERQGNLKVVTNQMRRDTAQERFKKRRRS